MLIALCIERSVRSWSAAWRHSVLLLALVVCLAIPPFQIGAPKLRMLPSIQQPSIQQLGSPKPEHGVTSIERPPESSHEKAVRDSSVEQNTESRMESATPVPRKLPSRPASKDFLPWLVAICFAGILCGIMRLVLSHLYLLRLVRDGKQISEGELLDHVEFAARKLSLTPPPRIVLHSNVYVPFACGVFRPTVVVGDDVLQRPAADQRGILLHEFGHVLQMATNPALAARLRLPKERPS